MNILSHNYDVIILTETWLHDCIVNSEFVDSRYSVFRCDRDRAVTKRHDGGGVLVAVLRSLRAVRCVLALPAVPLDIPPIIDHILLEFHIGKSYYLLSANYIPPGLDSDIYFNYFNKLEEIIQLNGYDNYYLIGDFNLPCLDWYLDGTQAKLLGLSNTTPPYSHLVNFMSVMDCIQVNIFKNNMNRLLDLCLTNVHNSKTFSAPITLVPPDVHHPPYYLLIPIDNNLSKPMPTNPRLRYCYKNANYKQISNDMLEINWCELFQNKTAEESVNVFYENIFDLIRKRVPSKRDSNSKFPVWFSPALIHIFKNKNKAWIKAQVEQNVALVVICAVFRSYLLFI
ncbi:unnamed protein product [Parnassius mnemosyne]|uniref:Endonuclease/exonuclease/phosphatase domain-containing protein n=1 Tax=Parnassius mnemosyne TaxID=213953 RepID=A0AAV1KHT5_9NEOP